MLIEIPFTGYSGLEKIPVSAVVGVLPSGITLGSISDSTATKDGLIILNIAKGANLGGSNILNGSIDITFKIENKNIVKKFSWCKTKDGADGSMTIYELFSSVPLLNKEINDVISPNKITFTSHTRKSNTTTTSPYEGITDVKGDVDEVNQLANNASQLANDVATKTAYINMSTDDTGSPCIELGKSDNEFKLRITNTSIDFMQGSQKIAYITNQSLYIQSSVVTDEMKVGDESGYIWKKRSNGNMGLRYVS